MSRSQGRRSSATCFLRGWWTTYRIMGCPPASCPGQMSNRVPFRSPSPNPNYIPTLLQIQTNSIVPTTSQGPQSTPYLHAALPQLNLSQLVPRMLRPNYISRSQHTLHERSPTLLAVSAFIHFFFFFKYIYTVCICMFFLWSATSLLVVSGSYWCV